MSRTLPFIIFLTILGTLNARLHAQDDQPNHYKLPPAHEFGTQPPDSAAAFPKKFNALPLSLDAISIACLGGQSVIYIPVLMNEPKLPIHIEAVTLDPMDWPKRNVFTKKLGRRSLHFADPGTTMLYGVMIDPANFQMENIGVGLVVVKRLDEKYYDVLIESNNGDLLAAARGELKVLDPSIGMGTLIPIPNQEDIRKHYGARWDLDPNKHCYPLFGQ